MWLLFSEKVIAEPYKLVKVSLQQVLFENYASLYTYVNPVKIYFNILFKLLLSQIYGYIDNFERDYITANSSRKGNWK